MVFCDLHELPLDLPVEDFDLTMAKLFTYSLGNGVSEDVATFLLQKAFVDRERLKTFYLNSDYTLSNNGVILGVFGVRLLRNLLGDQAWVLLKGSRTMFHYQIIDPWFKSVRTELLNPSIPNAAPVDAVNLLLLLKK